MENIKHKPESAAEKELISKENRFHDSKEYSNS